MKAAYPHLRKRNATTEYSEYTEKETAPNSDLWRHRFPFRVFSTAMYSVVHLKISVYPWLNSAAANAT